MTSQKTRVEKAVELALSGATVLTANPRAARALRLEADSQILPAKTVCATPDILPLTAWVSRTWTDCLLAGVVDWALLKPNVTAALWEQIVSDSPSGRQMMSHHAAARTALRAWELIQLYKLPHGRSAFSGTAETLAFHQWMESFQERCRTQNWIDSAAALAHLVANASRIPNLRRIFVAFGFDEHTPLETDLWEALRAAGITVVALSPEAEGPGDHAGVAKFTDAKAEIRAAALWARSQLESNPHTRIGILVPDLEQQRDEMEGVFSEYLHPEAKLLTNPPPAPCFDISLGHALGDHPAVRTALRLLRLLTSHLGADQFSLLLRSPYLGAGTSEAGARARCDSALRKKLRASVILNAVLSPDVRDPLAIAPGFFRVLQQSKGFAAKLPARITRSELAAEIRRILIAANWPGDGPGELTLTSAEFQVTSKWDSLLADFGALDQVLPPQSVPALLVELDRCASETTFATENAAAPIQIVGPLAASGEAFDAIWMCGLTDEAWPQRGRANPFLPFSLQEAAGLPQASVAASLHNAEQVTARVLQSAARCVLSWPEREEDRQLRPSPLLAGFANVDLNEKEFVTWAQRQNGVLLDAFEDEVAPALSEEFRANTKLLEWQSGCPFRAYAQTRLLADCLDEPTLGANPRDRGKTTEAALEYVWKGFRSLSNLETLTEAQIKQVIESAIEKALDEKFLKGDDTWLAPHRELERARLVVLINQWLVVERKRANFEAKQGQTDLTLKFDNLTIAGRADRIDQMDGKDVVIDYKTGGTKHSNGWWQPPRPRDPQLPIYAVALKREGHELAGVAFARVRLGSCGFSDEAISKQIFGKGTDKKYQVFEETVKEWDTELNRLAASFVSGNAEVDPNHGTRSAKSACNYCHLQALCRIAECNVIDEDEEDDEHGE